MPPASPPKPERNRCKLDSRRQSPPIVRSIWIKAMMMIGVVPAWGAEPLSLRQTLQQLDRGALVNQVMMLGDARRGAEIFHLPQFQCAKCHSVGLTSSSNPFVGPNLTTIPRPLVREQILDSLINPSATIRQGFETQVILDSSGSQSTGVLVREQEDVVVLRDAVSNQEFTIAKTDIEQRTVATLSLMPEDLVNQLGSLPQFLDLARYVIEVAEQGVERARGLQPGGLLTLPKPLPGYEQHIDHAGMIRGWNDEARDRGERIYQRVCANCHGTVEQAGSLPTSPRFAKGPFKNGTDPFRLYQTLTHGYGLMVPQHWMVPQQKYDVIHYIRETYFRPHLTHAYTTVTPAYLQKLPPGDTFGPEPSLLEPYVMMNYGNVLHHTYEIALNNTGKDIGWDLGVAPNSNHPWAKPDHYFLPGEAPNYAYKGIAIRLDPGAGGISRGTQWMVYDHDTMNVQAIWHGNSFIDYCSVQFNGQHNCHHRLTGTIDVEQPIGPGWAHPLTGSRHDPRPVGRDGRPYGPLPRSWLRYRGHYQHSGKVVLEYSVGSVLIREFPGSQPTSSSEHPQLVTRQFSIGPATHDLQVRIAPIATVDVELVGKTSSSPALEIREMDGFRWLHIPSHHQPLEIAVQIRPQSESENHTPPFPEYRWVDLTGLTNGGPAQWQERIETPIQTVHDEIFAVDELTLPKTNPWNCQMRATGHDFFSDGDAMAVCTWDGDVWRVEGLKSQLPVQPLADGGPSPVPPPLLVWQRIASGLFQPLGLKILDDQVFVSCRDQIVVLRDRNGDGETDFYECLNNDHQVTEHFHEFAMGLQADAQGNLYYAKSARHAKRAVVPHHGTLLRVTPDGRRTDIVATGFRAANGVCLNPDGSFFVTDQEGHWNPKNRINWVTEGGFYGNIYGFTDVTDSSDDAMIPPLCWITNRFDRSPAELLWVPRGVWGGLGGSLLNLSYGYGKVFIVPHERVGDLTQGGMCELPLPMFPSGLVRGRFSTWDHSLYLSSMFSWAGSRTEPGGFHRVRYQGKPAHLPLELHARPRQLEIRLSDPIEARSLTTKSFVVKDWDLRRTPDYGSDHHHERELEIAQVDLGSDQKTITLTIPQLEPTWCMSIEYQLQGENGRHFSGEIHNTIHRFNTNEPPHK